MRENPVETIEYRGFNINIYYDSDPINPRAEWDNFGAMVCFHSRYNLGDNHDFSSPEDFEEFAKENKLIILPLYLYDHSGITISTGPFSCPWDSGQVGWFYVEEEKAKKEWGWKVLTKERREKIVKYLEGEVEVYDQYLTGQVYGYIIEPKDENSKIECDDSCWGFYGYDHNKNGLLDYAKPSIDYAIKDYKERVSKEKKERVQMNTFFNSCWAY